MISAVVLLGILLHPVGDLRAQRCDGQLNIYLSDSTKSNNVFAGVSTFGGSATDAYRDHLTSSDGRFTISAYRISDAGARYPFKSIMANPKEDYITFYFGCDGDYLLRVIRLDERGKSSDTMLLTIEDACDEVFGMNLAFDAGAFRATICDTTARELEKDGMIVSRKYRVPSERYRSRLYGGYDVTATVHMDKGPSTMSDSSHGQLIYYDLTPKPYTPHRDVICVVYIAGYEDRVPDLIGRLELAEIKDYTALRDIQPGMLSKEREQLSEEMGGIHFFRKRDSSPIVGVTSEELYELRTSGLVDFAGCIIRFDANDFLAFDNRFIFTPKLQADTGRIISILHRHGVEEKSIVRVDPWWHVTAPAMLAEGVMDIMNELWASGEIAEMVNNVRQMPLKRQ